MLEAFDLPLWGVALSVGERRGRGSVCRREEGAGVGL